MIRYIIDGHNMINSVPHYTRILQHNYGLCLKTLYQDLLNYAHSRSVKINLVFDGNPPWDPPENTNRISIEFSGKILDADTKIINQAEKWQGRQTVVVSEDRNVLRATTGFGCQTLSPREFSRLIVTKRKLKDRTISNQDKKPEQLTKSEILWWKTEMERALSKKKK